MEQKYFVSLIIQAHTWVIKTSAHNQTNKFKENKIIPLNCSIEKITYFFVLKINNSLFTRLLKSDKKNNENLNKKFALYFYRFK